MKNIPDGHVRMEQKLCAACGNKFDSGALLLHLQLRSIPKDKTLTGWGTCPSCQQRINDGFVILIEANAPAHAQRLNPEDADRTGRMMFVRKELAARIFNVEVPASIAFVEAGVIEKLQAMYREQVGEEVPNA